MCLSGRRELPVFLTLTQIVKMKPTPFLLAKKQLVMAKTYTKFTMSWNLKKKLQSVLYLFELCYKMPFAYFVWLLGHCANGQVLLCWFCLVFPLVYNILTPQWIISSKDFIVSMIYLYKEGLEKLKQIWLKQLLILVLTLTELRARSCVILLLKF